MEFYLSYKLKQPTKRYPWIKKQEKNTGKKI